MHDATKHLRRKGRKERKEATGGRAGGIREEKRTETRKGGKNE